MEDKSTPSPGDIIEFEASLRRNPVVETIESLLDILAMAILFEDDPTKSQKQKNKQAQTSDNQKMKSQMEAFCEKLKAGNTIDLTAEGLRNNYTAVVTLETEFLNDPTMSDVVDGRFCVVGKVIRSIVKGTESISLIRKTALSKIPQPVLHGVLGGLSQLATEPGFAIPKLDYEIQGPAIQVIPIAIYA